MSALRISVLLQIIGFLLTSFFIAVLRVETFRKMADTIKNRIVKTADRQNIMVDTMLRVVSKVSIILIITGKMNTSRQKDMKWFQYFRLRVREIITKHVPLILLSIGLLISDFIAGVFERIAKPLVGKDVITNLLIVLGTLILFIGLIIEFIVVK